VVLLKAGEDAGRIGEISEDGFRLTFDANPRYRVKPGESLHIKDPNLEIGGPLFTDAELSKLAVVKASGLIDRWFLSYVQERRDVELFREVVGPDDLVMLKIEDKRGLRFVRTWHRTGNERLVAACGDLHVEVDQPHHILDAVRLIVDADPTAVAGSRMLLSIAREKMPSYADFAQLAWLRSVGFGSYLLCDELCLKGDLLGRAVNAFGAWAGTLR
jgi:pyruvate kinase